MSESKYTPGALAREFKNVAIAHAVDTTNYSPVLAGLPDGGGVGTVELRNANLDRAIACWNACEGINPSEIPNVIEALQECVQSMRHHGIDSEAVKTAEMVLMRVRD